MSQAMLTKSYQRDRDDAAFASLCELARVPVEVIHAKRGDAAVCAARRAIATELRERGWTWARIARAMRRDDWSVRWLVRTGQTEKGGAK